MVYICTFMPSQPILDTGYRWVAEAGKHADGKWQRN
jgi:hypothetical protein